MRLRKNIFRVIVVSLCILSISTIGLTVYAKNVNDSVLRYSDFYTYTYTSKGDYSQFIGRPNVASIAATNASYYGSWKYIFFETYGDSSGVLYRLDWDSDSGMGNAMSASCPSDSYVVQRHYVAQLRRSASNTSSMVDGYNIDVYK